MSGADIPPALDRTSRSRTLRALSMDVAVRRALREGRYRGFVHSVFRRVVNIACTDGELFTIASRDLDNAPNTLIVDTAGFAATGIDRGDPVDSIDARISIGNQVDIRVDSATRWDALLPSYPADDLGLRRNLATVRSHLGWRGIGGVSSPGDAPSAFALEMTAMLERHAALLCAALCRGDLAAARTHGRAMVGLGPGLTPSGDDFLVGLFAVLHVPASPCHDFKSLCVEILADIDQRTNAISVAALKAAACGRVRESIQTLIGEFVSAPRERFIAALSPVLMIGSTSGADLVIGIVSGFEVNMQCAALERVAA